MSLWSSVEIQVFFPVEKAKPLSLIINAVGMDDVHHDGDSHPVGCVNQFLELLRCAEPRAQGEKVRDLVAERPVLRMLLEGHDLDRVITEVLDPRQHILPELAES